MSAPDEAFNAAVQDGVLSAVLHVAAASALDARELALEFEAARTVVEQTSRAHAHNTSLGSALRNGLSIERLKILVQRRMVYDAALEPLRVSIALMESEHSEDAALYRELILSAALAAARTKLAPGFGDRVGVTLRERTALAEITAAFERSQRDVGASGV